MTYFGKDYCSYLTQSLVQRNASVVAVVCCSTASVPILSLFTGHKVCTPTANVLERFDMYMGNSNALLEGLHFQGNKTAFSRALTSDAVHILSSFSIYCVINTLIVELCFYLLAGTVKKIPEDQI